MGIAKKTDGRYVVGVGVDNANDYKGSAAYRDIYIQLTSSGATAKSEEYLTFLKDYAVNANALGEPIMPPSVNVWISNNGVTTAVEADDVSIDGNNYTICGIKWNGSTWDYSGAGQGKSGGGLPSYTPADKGKVLTIGEGEGSVTTVIVPEQTVTQTEGPIPLTGVDVSGFAVGVSGIMTINGTEYNVTAEESVGGAIAFPALEAEVIIVLDNGVVTLGTPNPGTYTVSLSASVPSVEPKWEAAGGVATYVDIGNKTVAANSADYAIYVNGNELTSFAACKAYLEGIQDNDIRIRDRHGWQGISGLTIHEDEGIQIAVIYQQIGTNSVRFGYAYEE